MKVVRKKVKDLKLAPYNPRYMPEEEKEKLKRSIEVFGFVEPLVWNKRTGHVIGGNHRLMVLQELGYEEVDVVVVDLSLEEEKALNIALNKISGEWNYDKLMDILDELDKVGLAQYTGFDDVDIEKLADEVIGLGEEKKEEEDVEEEEEEDDEDEDHKGKKYVCPRCGRTFYV